MDLKAALAFAIDAHRGQKKGSGAPFLYHPLAVASLVLKHGGSEAQAMAAILHDTIGGPDATPSLYAERFGTEVAELVFAFADPELPPGQPDEWRTRRRAYLEKLRGLEPAALLVVACEELHEIDELLQDLKYVGVSVWKRFPVPHLDVGWYFKELLPIFYAKLAASAQPLVSEYAARVKRLNEIVFS